MFIHHNKRYKVNQPMVDFRFFTRRFSISYEIVSCYFNKKLERVGVFDSTIRINERMIDGEKGTFDEIFAL